MQALFLHTVEHVREALWQPAMDIYRTPYGWLLKLELAGVDPQDILVTLEGRRLTIRGVRRDRCLEEACQYVRMEIAYSRFERSIELPRVPCPNRITSEYRDGMLLVRIAE
ncbi:MAG: heat-shock protein Hsp20 [Gemmataceae bacterium]